MNEPDGIAVPASWRENAGTTLLALWLVAAVFADGWAHVNRPTLESFFTPWHGALYSGFAVLVAWFAVLARRRAGTFRDIRAVPAGYG